MPMLIVFRVDASLVIGTGHVIRCLTLADKLQARDARCIFVTRLHKGHLADLIRNRGYEVYSLPAPLEGSLISAEDNGVRLAHADWLGCTWQDDAEQTLAKLYKLDVNALVVDHYALDARWETKLRAHCRAVMVIDDLADRTHDCDLLLDQNWFAPEGEMRYAAKVGNACKLLLGPEYALIGNEYATLRQLLPQRDGIVRRILVFLGGSDSQNETGKVMEALLDPRFSTILVDVVIGLNHPEPARIRWLASKRQGITVHQGLPSLAGLIFKADLMIGGGGATSWERMSLGTPAFVISIAENQFKTNEAMAMAGYIEFAGSSSQITSSDISEKLGGLLDDSTRLREMSMLGVQLVNAKGASLVADALIEIIEQNLVNVPHVPSDTSLRLLILTDPVSWLLPYAKQLAEEWIREGHRVSVKHDCRDLDGGDFCFCLGFGRIVPRDFRGRFRNTLVVHESDLPHGRGWAPMAWQILEGRNRIPVSLIEAADEVDSGVIYAQEWIDLNGTELNPEWRALQAIVTKRLCRAWVNRNHELLKFARSQTGPATYYARRRPEDSRLDVEKSIADQFDLLRIVDNKSYPAFFTHRGRTFLIRIEAKDWVTHDS